MTTNQPYTDRTTYEGTARPRTVYQYDVDTTVMPVDRVRWAAVLAGFLTVIASMTVFTILGFALGLATFDANNPNSFLAGAGIYGAITGLISFGLGGFIAARTAAVSGIGNSILQGGMVWIVTNALIVLMLGNGIGVLLNVAGDAATTAASIAGPVIGQVGSEVAQDPQLQATAAAGAEEVAPQVEGAIQDAQQQIQSITPQDVEMAAQDVSQAAWWAFLVAGLTAAAALVGGVIGTRRYLTQELTADNRPA